MGPAWEQAAPQAKLDPLHSLHFSKIKENDFKVSGAATSNNPALSHHAFATSCLINLQLTPSC
jgi:hypothetical protein